MSEDLSMSPLDADRASFACFEVKGRVYAVAVGYVREIVRPLTVTPLPDAPPAIEGVVDLRGALIPVIDLSRALDLGPGAASSQSRIVVLESEGLILALRVDAATDVLSVESSRVEAIPVLAADPEAGVLGGAIRRSGEAPVLILAVERLIAHVAGSLSRIHAQSESPPAWSPDDAPGAGV